MTKKHLKVLALIPARIGSKSIPRKNLRSVAGKPLIAWSIEHGLNSRLITRVVVSTDDEETAEIARSWGADVPFLRPAEISGDHATDFEFHLHALQRLKEDEGYVPDQVVQLRPTTPSRRPEVIDDAITMFDDHPEADSLRAVTRACFTPYKMWTIDKNGYLRTLLTLPDIREPYNTPRQLLPEVWQQDGYLDITRPRTVFEQGSTTGKKLLPFFLPSVSMDIDVERELQEAAQQLGGSPRKDEGTSDG